MREKFYGTSKSAAGSFQMKTLDTDKVKNTVQDQLEIVEQCLRVLSNKNRRGETCVRFATCSCIVPVAFLSRVTACEWLMPSAEVPQMLTMRSPIWKE